MLVAIGWNGMESHQMPRAPGPAGVFQNPNKILAVIDPRNRKRLKSLTCIWLCGQEQMPSLLRAVIAIIIQEGWYNQDYIDQHVTGFPEIWPYLKDFDITAALKVQN